MKHHDINPTPIDPQADHLADLLDDLIPPGRTDLPAYDLPDPALDAARHLAGAEHPVMAADRVNQLEAQLLMRAAVQQQRQRQQSKRRIVRLARWAVAAVVLIVFAVTLALGIALLDDNDPHILTPDNTAYDSPNGTGASSSIQPISRPSTVRQSRDSSVFVIPPGP